MTKQQAREKAEIEFHTTGREIFLDDLAMEIYAIAFFKWAYYNCDMAEGGRDNDMWTNIYMDEEGEPTEYTTAKLLTEFEKI